MRLSLLLLASVAILPVHGSVLTFDIAGMGNYDDIPAAYGDNITATTDGGFSYGQGNGFTPNIVVDYATLNTSTGAVVATNLDWWNNDYGDLQGVAFPVNGSSIAELTLSAAPGFLVRLNSFDLAGYNHWDHPNSQVRILNGAGQVVLDYSPVTIEGDANGPQHSTFLPNLVGSTIRIRFAYNDWNIGIDNVNFDELAGNPTGIPEPGTWLLSAAGLSMLALVRNRR